MASKFTELVIDAAEPRQIAQFWAAVLGYRVTDDSNDNDVELQAPDGSPPSLLFTRVPEGKSVKNRLHIDVNPSGQDQQAELQRLIELGARHVDIGQGEQTWFVLADPEGNEFCLLRTTV